MRALSVAASFDSALLVLAAIPASMNSSKPFTAGGLVFITIT